MERPQIQRKKCVDGNKAEWPSGLRRQTQESHQSRILAHECVLGFESHSCQKTFWTRWSRAFSRKILSNWNVNWRWQSKAKNKKILTSSVTDSRAVYKCRKRKITSRDMWKTKARVGLNANLFKWMTQTIWQITSLNWKKITQWKGHKSNEKKCVHGNKAEWPSGLRSQAQENPQSRILVHECARGFECHSCQKTFWTRWGRAFSWQILSYWNINSRWQCKAKENKKMATSSVVDNRVV